jgi:hypothetical protein
MPSAVHLEEFRCSGAAHGGCQARCLVFWKEAWLARADDAEGAQARDVRPSFDGRSSQAGCTEEDVIAGTRRRDAGDTPDDPAYVCQSTQIPHATVQLSKWDWSQYVEDYTSGNVRLSQMLGSFLFFLCEQVVAAGLGLRTAVYQAYDAVQKVRGGTPYPVRIGMVPPGTPTPVAKLDLQVGELVRVRSHQDILQTLNEDLFNRGMAFDAEMVPFCGGTYRVLDRIDTIINEKTGKMQRMKNACIILDGVVCQACYAKYRKFCPRRTYPYWREIWLERIGPEGGSGRPAADKQRADSAALG